MRTLTTLTAVIALTALGAQADVLPYPAEGGLVLTVDIPTGTATLTNASGAPLDVDGFEIVSSGGNLDPVAWNSIADQAVTDPLGVLAKLGAGGLSFGELTATTHVLAEGNLSNAGVFQPADPFAIGAPVLPGTACVCDLQFYYKTVQISGDKYIGLVQVVPEPATIGLLGIGGLLALRRRRKA
jgi:hypothetical protein